MGIMAGILEKNGVETGGILHQTQSTLPPPVPQAPQTVDQALAAMNGQSSPGGQFDQTLSDWSPEDQRRIAYAAQQLGIQPAGVINGEVVDANGQRVGISTADFEKFLPPVGFQNMQQPAAPATGLIGSEQALTGGLSGAIDANLQGAGMARGDISTAAQQAQNQLGVGRQQTVDAALTANQMSQQGLQTGKQQVVDAALTANQMAQQGLGQGRMETMQEVARQQQLAASPMMGFLNQGQQAGNLQSAQAGVFGPQAQQQAYNQFIASPGQQFLREQAELGTTRNAAALGGLGGGRVRQELQRQAMGMAQQDFGNQFNRLGQIAGQGLQAGGQIAGTTAQLGGQGVGQLGANRQTGAGITGNLGGQVVGQMGSLSGTGAGITGNLGGQVVGQLGSSQQFGAQMAGQAGQAMGNVAQQTGQGVGNLISGTGSQIGQDRLQIGRDMSQNIGGTSAQLSNLANQLGMSVSDLLGATGGNLAGLLSGTGAQVAQGQQNLGTTLGNTYMGQGSQSVGAASSIPGVQQIQGNAGQVIGGLGGLATGIGALMPATQPSTLTG